MCIAFSLYRQNPAYNFFFSPCPIVLIPYACDSFLSLSRFLLLDPLPPFFFFFFEFREGNSAFNLFSPLSLSLSLLLLHFFPFPHSAHPGLFSLRRELYIPPHTRKKKTVFLSHIHSSFFLFFWWYSLITNVNVLFANVQSLKTKILLGEISIILFSFW